MYRPLSTLIDVISTVSGGKATVVFVVLLVVEATATGATVSAVAAVVVGATVVDVTFAASNAPIWSPSAPTSASAAEVSGPFDSHPIDKTIITTPKTAAAPNVRIRRRFAVAVLDVDVSADPVEGSDATGVPSSPSSDSTDSATFSAV
jgi:hypothetical protein